MWGRGRTTILAIGAFVATVGIAAGALGYWTGSGAGAATATLDSSQALDLSPGSPSTQVSPGRSAGVATVASNPNPYPVEISSISLDVEPGFERLRRRRRSRRLCSDARVHCPDERRRRLDGSGKGRLDARHAPDRDARRLDHGARCIQRLSGRRLHGLFGGGGLMLRRPGLRAGARHDGRPGPYDSCAGVLDRGTRRSTARHRGRCRGERRPGIGAGRQSRGQLQRPRRLEPEHDVRRERRRSLSRQALRRGHRRASNDPLELRRNDPRDELHRGERASG